MNFPQLPAHTKHYLEHTLDEVWGDRDFCPHTCLPPTTERPIK